MHEQVKAVLNALGYLYCKPCADNLEIVVEQEVFDYDKTYDGDCCDKCGKLL